MKAKELVEHNTTVYIIEVTVPNDVDPSAILEAAQALSSELLEQSGLADLADDTDLAVEDELANAVSVTERQYFQL